MRSTVYLDGPECKGPLAHARGYVEGTWAREHWHRTSAPDIGTGHWHRNIGTERLAPDIGTGTSAPNLWHRTLASNIGTEHWHRTLASNIGTGNIGTGNIGAEHRDRRSAPNIGAGTLAPEHWRQTWAPNMGTEHCHRTLAGMLAPNVYPANVARIVAPRVSKGTESSKPEAGSTRIGL
jgi:hypothetical protein